MASENVKIVIKEVNETSPKGAGASSDIAYIPGLAVDTAISRNIPVLCNTIAEFEYNFGDTPYKFTKEDVEDMSETTKKKVGDSIIEDGYDLSYIYAKELLNAGMSVYYENIAADDESIKALEEALANAKVVAQTAEATYREAVKATKAAETELKNATDETRAEKQIALTNAQAAEEAALTAWNDAKTAVDTANKTYEASKDRVDYLYEVLNDRLEVLLDKDEYTVKYITTGGYPTFTDIESPENNTLAAKVVDVAYQRGDAVGLVDHVNNPSLSLDPFNEKSIYAAVNKFTWSNGSFGAMFTPYAKYSCMTLADDTNTNDINEALQIMPASFGYLMCMAAAIKTSPNWLAMAGVTRGGVPNIQTLTPNQLLSNLIAEEYQPKFGAEGNNISVNAITNVKPYGLTVWGNRTLEKVDPKGTTALNFLNTRNMVSDIKKLAHTTAKSLMFEQDSDALWLKFKSKITPLMEQLKTGFGISDYKILRATTKINGDPLTRGELAAVLRIYPLYAIEYFDITVAISEQE